MGHMYDPNKSPNENKEEALEDAGPATPSFVKKVARKRINGLVEEFIGGRRKEIKISQIAGHIEAALEHGALSESEVDHLLTKVEREIHTDKLFPNVPAKGKLKRLKKIKKGLRSLDSQKSD